MSIATKHGDGGQTGLVGGIRVSKADLRVEAYGTVDELNAQLGFARSICSHAQISAWIEEIQRMLFRVGGALATPEDRRKGEPLLTNDDVEKLTAIVDLLEGREGVLTDWSVPGGHTESAACEVARTVCRRAERCVVRFTENGGDAPAEVVAYLNRLSDVIWLFGRIIELDAGVNSRLRDDGKAGPNFSRAW